MGFKKTTLGVLVGALLTTTGSAMAATPTDTDSSTITATIGEGSNVAPSKGDGLRLIEGLGNIDFGALTAANFTKGTNFCIYSSGANNSFDMNVNIAGSGTNGAFELSGESDATQKINYSVQLYSNVNKGGTASAVLNGSTDKVLMDDVPAVSLDSNYECTGGTDGNNSSLYVTLDAGASSAKADKYEGTLTLTLSAL